MALEAGRTRLDSLFGGHHSYHHHVFNFFCVCPRQEISPEEAVGLGDLEVVRVSKSGCLGNWVTYKTLGARAIFPRD